MAGSCGIIGLVSGAPGGTSVAGPLHQGGTHASAITSNELTLPLCYAASLAASTAKTINPLDKY
jgi:hypothetical protein